jgi:hypothetical protein
MIRVKIEKFIRKLVKVDINLNDVNTMETSNEFLFIVFWWKL